MLLSTWLSERRGRGAALARHLEIPPSMVAKMAAGKKPVPLEHTPYIQHFTENQVTCEELCPDKKDFFALVRKLGCASGAGAAVADRRQDHERAAVYANTLADRRAPAGTGE